MNVDKILRQVAKFTRALATNLRIFNNPEEPSSVSFTLACLLIKISSLGFRADRERDSHKEELSSRLSLGHRTTYTLKRTKFFSIVLLLPLRPRHHSLLGFGGPQ